MPVKTPRKRDAEIPELDGWNFHPFTTNLFLSCQKCGGLRGEMFYRSIKDEGMAWHRTESICVPCAKK